MDLVFDPVTRCLKTEAGVPVTQLRLKRYDKVTWRVRVEGATATSVSFTGARFDGTGVLPLTKSSASIGADGYAELSPLTNTAELRDALLRDGKLQESIEFPGEFVVTDDAGHRVASVNIPIVYGAAIDSPDAVLEDMGRATLTVSMTTLPAGSQGSARVAPTATGYDIQFEVPEGAAGADGVSPDLGNYKGPIHLMDSTGKSIIKLTGSKLDVGCGNVSVDLHASGTGLDGLRLYDSVIELHPYDINQMINDGYVKSIGNKQGEIDLGTNLSFNGQMLNASGSSVDLSNYVKKTDYASGSQYGLVKIGSNLSVSNGVLSINYASTSSYGVMRVGSNLSVISGIVSGQSSSGSSGGVESVNGLTGALEIQMGTMNHPEDSSIIAMYVKVRDSYGNTGTATGGYMMGMKGASAGPYTQCLDLPGGDLSNYQGTVNIRDEYGNVVLASSGGEISIGSGIGKITLYGPSNTTVEVTGGLSITSSNGITLNGTSIHN